MYFPPHTNENSISVNNEYIYFATEQWAIKMEREEW